MNNSTFTPYQYSVIRYHHDAGTNEFLNIGLSMFAPELNFFRANISTKYGRITEAFYDMNGDEYRNHVNLLIRRFDKLNSEFLENQGGLFASKDPDIELLLRKYLRKESSFRYSTPSSGISPASAEALNETFERLFFDYVEKYVPKKDKDSRTEDEVWRGVYKPQFEKVEKQILEKLQPRVVKTPIDELIFDHAWKNGQWHLLQPISFDLVRPGSIIEKAQRNLGRNVLLNSGKDISHLYLLLGKPKNKPADVNKSYNKAKDIIIANHFDYDIELIEENDAKDFAAHLWKEMQYA